MYRFLIRPVFFLFDAEKIHETVLKYFSKSRLLFPLLRKLYAPSIDNEVKVNNLNFIHPLGLAAGFDKNGIAIGLWQALGFSHIEVGTVTPVGQEGNPKPRIFRLKKDKALINRLGFNNRGADKVRENILETRKSIKPGFIIGVNIGKNKNTSVKDAFEDYKICFEKLYDVADYFTLNISSPNTEGLRKLHEEDHLDNLLSEIQKLNSEISSQKKSELKNIFLKISPDMNDEMIEMVFKLSLKHKIGGIIATNTTVERHGLQDQINQQGGLSGKPLKPLADRVLKKLHELNSESGNKMYLIGVGGVFDRNDFNTKMNYGSSLVQVYTGFIYNGPSIIRKLLSN